MIVDTNELKKAAAAVYLACEEEVARDLSQKLKAAAAEIDIMEKYEVLCPAAGTTTKSK